MIPPDKLTQDTKEMFQNIANYGGGPAYPMQMQWGMTDGVPNIWFAVGLTKREQFAAMLMSAVIPTAFVDEAKADLKQQAPTYAEMAVTLADALLERLKKP